MKRLASIVAVLAALTVPTSAADIPARVYTKAPVMAVPAFNWTGFYIGGHLGGAWTDFGNNDAVFMGGGQIGVDFQFAPNWVFGIEGQYSVVDNSFALGDLASATLRLGYNWGPTLLYAKGGYGYADGRNFGSRDGYTIGGGLEYLFAPNWSGKIEYQFFDFDNNVEAHTIKVGLNYRFNWAGLRF